MKNFVVIVFFNMNESKTKGLTNLNSDGQIVMETFVFLARMYFSQFAAVFTLFINCPR